MASEEHRQHVIPVSIYVGIWATLMVLTGLTVFASFLELGDWNIVLALVIATIKGTLVVLFFMHLYYSSKLTKVTIIAALFFLFLLLALSMTDYLTRGWLTNPMH
ncbi:MAG TPA: cytochrome C oxidase subunit IV family protein [Candidatus Angelobacter sp.]|jgi:cytochrome c oxidase subunit 4|nr:cytochrome C oxidase subunit IV family protein [Candidatus Angelobacter sp.]